MDTNNPQTELDRESDKLLFAKEDNQISDIKTDGNPPWNLLIVDDEDDIHQVTKMVLNDFSFQDRGIAFHHAYSAAQAKTLLEGNTDIAIILLDVVMESDDSGLQLVKTIREELNNKYVRIILRTGQPGLAPLKSVIVDYDINDYKEKDELTDQKLYATMVASLREYQHIAELEEKRRALELNRIGLEKIINSSHAIFELQSLRTFAQGVLIQFESLSGLDVHSLYTQVDGFSAIQDHMDFRILAGTGCYEGTLENQATEVLSSVDLERISQAVSAKENLFGQDYFIYQVENSEGLSHVLYIHGDQLSIENVDRELLEVFNSNISVAFENLHLNQEIELTQREIIYTLGEVTEARSYDTGYHVKRVGEYSRIMARACGLSIEQANLLKVSAALHDVGKVGIPDAILNKPGPLSDDECKIMKEHTTIGHRLLGKSKRIILKTASTIAWQHHEYFDGSGYPLGLKGEAIDIFARITSISDVFDALSSDRIYRPAWDDERIYNYIKENSGTMFDPKIVESFFNTLPELLEIRELFAD